MQPSVAMVFAKSNAENAVEALSVNTIIAESCAENVVAQLTAITAEKSLTAQTVEEARSASITMSLNAQQSKILDTMVTALIVSAICFQRIPGQLRSE